MKQSLKVLILEDSPTDADLMLLQLFDASIEFSSRVVDTKKEYLESIEEFKPDIILSDYNLPEFDGLSALKIKKEILPDVPFIMVSGAFGEEFAVETLKKGATDYVLKDNISKLVPAVRRALEEAEEYSKRKKAEQQLKKYQDSLEKQVENRTAELAKSNAELEHFAHVASHDLREPLRMITSFLQLLERRYSDKLDQEANEFIGFAVDGAKRLDNMIIDLLEYSKVTKKEMEFDTINYEQILEQSLINLKVPIDENNAIVTHDSLPIIDGDANLLVQLFQNLIGNAIKYHDTNIPKIHISAIREENYYRFSVKDNGIGIDSQHLKRIFTIFQRLHSKEEYEGTGIGLAIVQKIVHQHKGKIWVESELGKGSTFYFTIPINAFN